MKWFDIKQAIDVIKDIPFRVMREPLLYYLKEKKTKENWIYIEDNNSKIELLNPLFHNEKEREV